MNKLQKILGLGALVVALGCNDGFIKIEEKNEQEHKSMPVGYKYNPHIYELPADCKEIVSFTNNHGWHEYLCKNPEGNYIQYSLDGVNKRWVLNYKFVRK